MVKVIYFWNQPVIPNGLTEKALKVYLNWMKLLYLEDIFNARDLESDRDLVLDLDLDRDRDRVLDLDRDHDLECRRKRSRVWCIGECLAARGGV